MCFLNIEFTYSQCDAWTQKTDFAGTARRAAAGFSIGNKGYVGIGYDGSYRKDFWEYNPFSNTWTQKADFGGTARSGAVGFSISSKGYIGTGFNGVTNYKDFWEYDTLANNWTQRAAFGGTARRNAVGFSIGPKGYIGTGYDGNRKKDFWEYDPSGNTWTQRVDFGGTARDVAVGFSIGNKGYIGTGDLGSGVFSQDFWEYDPLNNTWTQKANLGGTTRAYAAGFSIGSKGYIGTGWGVGVDFWEWDQATNTWTQKADFGAVARRLAVGFSINNKGYIGTGYDGSNYQDFWEYTPSAPVIDTVVSTDVTGCYEDSTGTVSITATGTGILSYSIDSGITFPDTTGSFTSLNAGSYNVVVQDGNGCTDTGSTIIITEPYAITTLSISSTPDTNNTGIGTATISVGGGTPPYTFLWAPSGQTDSTAIGLTIGMYIINIQDSNVCSYVDSIYVDNFTGIIDIDNINNHIMFYPNPTNEILNISLDRFDSKEIDLKILDILGKTMYESRKINTYKLSNKFIIVTGLEKGLYFIIIHTDKSTLTQKLIIQ